MTDAWTYYVTSQQFMTELRGLTPNYPFCRDVVTDAHARVIGDGGIENKIEGRGGGATRRSWNLCWLILAKVQTE